MNKVVTLNKSKYKILSEVTYVTEKEPDKPYKKYKLNNGKILVVSELEDFACLGEDLGDLGVELGVEKINHKGVDYRLNYGDYQLVLNVDQGDPLKVEGEVKFWDYEGIEDSNKIISLGLVMRLNKRSDVVSEAINKKDISFREEL